MRIQQKLAAKRALLKVLDKELGDLAGRFLSPEEQLRALSLGDEISHLEGTIKWLEHAEYLERVHN